MMWHLKGLGGGTEVEGWPFWEYEHHAAKLLEVLEKEKKAREGKDGNSSSLSDPRSDANRMMKQAQQSIKTPNFGSFKFPK